MALGVPPLVGVVGLGDVGVVGGAEEVEPGEVVGVAVVLGDAAVEAGAAIGLVGVAVEIAPAEAVGFSAEGPGVVVVEGAGWRGGVEVGFGLGQGGDGVGLGAFKGWQRGGAGGGGEVDGGGAGGFGFSQIGGPGKEEVALLGGGDLDAAILAHGAVGEGVGLAPLTGGVVVAEEGGAPEGAGVVAVGDPDGVADGGDGGDVERVAGAGGGRGGGAAIFDDGDFGEGTGVEVVVAEEEALVGVEAGVVLVATGVEAPLSFAALGGDPEAAIAVPGDGGAALVFGRGGEAGVGDEAIGMDVGEAEVELAADGAVVDDPGAGLGIEGEAGFPAAAGFGWNGDRVAPSLGGGVPVAGLDAGSAGRDVLPSDPDAALGVGTGVGEAVSGGRGFGEDLFVEEGLALEAAGAEGDDVFLVGLAPEAPDGAGAVDGEGGLVEDAGLGDGGGDGFEAVGPLGGQPEGIGFSIVLDVGDPDAAILIESMGGEVALDVIGAEGEVGEGGDEEAGFGGSGLGFLGSCFGFGGRFRFVVGFLGLLGERGRRDGKDERDQGEESKSHGGSGNVFHHVTLSSGAHSADLLRMRGAINVSAWAMPTGSLRSFSTTATSRPFRRRV